MTLGYHFFSRTIDAERVKKKTAERLQRKKLEMNYATSILINQITVKF